MFATGEFKDHVNVWSIQQRRRVQELSTILDFGGLRLAMTSQVCPKIIAGSWKKGVAAYDCQNGQVLWSRADLRTVQEIRDFSDLQSSRIGIGLDRGPYHILMAENGSTHSETANVRQLYKSDFAPLYLMVTTKRMIHLSSEMRLPSIWKRSLASFGVLDAAFSQQQVVYAEAGGLVYCIDFYGSEIWRFSPDPHHHVMRVVWDSDFERWLAVDWNVNGGPKRLIEIDKEGAACILGHLGECWATEFYRSGQLVITSSGQIISTRTLTPVWEFH